MTDTRHNAADEQWRGTCCLCGFPAGHRHRLFPASLMPDGELLTIEQAGGKGRKVWVHSACYLKQKEKDEYPDVSNFWSMTPEEQNRIRRRTKRR